MANIDTLRKVARHGHFYSKREEGQVLALVDAGLCAFVPHRPDVAIYHDEIWGVNTSLILTKRGCETLQKV